LRNFSRRRQHTFGNDVSERPSKTKIGTGVAHVTRDSGTTFNVKGELAGAGHIVATDRQTDVRRAVIA